MTYYIVVDGYTGGDWLDSEVRWLDSQVGCIRVCSGLQPDLALLLLMLLPLLSNWVIAINLPASPPPWYTCAIAGPVHPHHYALHDRCAVMPPVPGPLVRWTKRRRGIV